MSLEDRIRNTGEHFLGTFDSDPGLPQLIEDRLALRMRRHRQRTAVGIGVGAVVVFGGLAVVNADRGSAPPLAATQEQPAEFSAATTAPPPSTEAVQPSPGTDAATTDPATSEPATIRTLATVAEPSTAPPAAAPTVVPPMADDAPMLYTAAPGTGISQIDLSTGRSELGVKGSLAASTPARADVASSYVLARSAPDTERDRCGQFPLGGPGTETEGSQLPAFAAALVISDDGTRGFVESASCPEPGTLAGGPLVDPGDTTIAGFSPGDPTAPLTEILRGSSLLEASADGRFVLTGSSDGLEVTDTTTGTTAAIGTGCTSFRSDPATGFLVGADGFAALAWCDGDPAVLAGRLDSITTSWLSTCGEESVLAVRDANPAEPSTNWFAVHDPVAATAWIVSEHGVSPPIPVGAEVAWHLVS